jgi:hypothetical protein
MPVCTCLRLLFSAYFLRGLYEQAALTIIRIDDMIQLKGKQNDGNSY